jgi:hypothetical protein
MRKAAPQSAQAGDGVMKARDVLSPAPLLGTCTNTSPTLLLHCNIKD